MYKVEIAGQSVRAVTREGDGNSVLGTVGVEQVSFTFDKSWDGLTKFACFKNTGRPRRQQEVQVVLDDTGVVTIPWEMYTASGSLYVGVLGLSGQEIVKPTVWTLMCSVVKGVDPDGDAAKEATPTLIQQMVDIVESVREDADSGAFDGKDGVDGKDGRDGVDGKDGKDGETGPAGPPGPKGDPFKYSDFTEAQLSALRGPRGPQGYQGVPGRNGIDGDSAYNTAVKYAGGTDISFLKDEEAFYYHLFIALMVAAGYEKIGDAEQYIERIQMFAVGAEEIYHALRYVEEARLGWFFFSPGLIRIVARADGAEISFEHPDHSGEEDSRAICLNDYLTDITSAIQLHDRSTSQYYNIYGEHNKPKPADIGAVTAEEFAALKQRVEALEAQLASS